MITGYGATIVDGAWLTLQLALLSMLLAIVLGLLGVSTKEERSGHEKRKKK